MAQKIKRTLRKQAISEGSGLPSRLAFLKSIRFHSLVEDKTGSKTQFRVEVTARTLKSLLDELKTWKKKAEPNEQALTEAHASASKYRHELEQKTTDLERAINALGRQNRTIEEYNAQLGERGVPKSSSPFKSHLSVAEERGFKPNGRPLQGGLPSLGKRR